MDDLMSGERPAFGGGGIKELFRTLGAILGLAMILFGGYWSLKLFFTIMRILEAPENLKPLLNAWGALLNLKTFQIATAQGTVNVDLQWIAVSFLGGGAFLLISIAIRLVKAGTGLLAAMVMDIESLKKIISKTITANMNKSGLGQGSGTQAL